MRLHIYTSYILCDSGVMITGDYAPKAGRRPKAAAAILAAELLLANCGWDGEGKKNIPFDPDRFEVFHPVVVEEGFLPAGTKVRQDPYKLSPAKNGIETADNLCTILPESVHFNRFDSFLAEEYVDSENGPYIEIPAELLPDNIRSCPDNSMGEHDEEGRYWVQMPGLRRPDRLNPENPEGLEATVREILPPVNAPPVLE